MQTFSATPLALGRSLRANNGLIRQMIRREISSKYKGSAFGLAWSFVTPLFMLAVYTFIFSVIFSARWPQAQSNLEFSGILFSGLIVYTLFAECIARAPSLILSNVNYVKKVVFPLETLPWIALGSSLFHAMISLLVLFAFLLTLNGSLHWTVVLIPVIWLPLIFLTVGLSLLLASLGTYLRDIGQAIGLIVSSLMFLSPIFYPSTAFPESYRFLFYFNPLTFIIEQTRDVVLWGHLPSWSGLGLYYLCSLAVLFLGFAWFQKTRRGFADVL